jgi:hypothetical protein
MDIPDLVAVKPLANYRVWLRFEDGTEGEADFSHLAGKGVFRLWNDYRRFEEVYASEAGAIAWSDTVEICPDAAYLRITGKSLADFPPESRQPMSHAGA